MSPTGEMPIGGRLVFGSGPSFHATDAATGAKLDTAFGTATLEDLKKACALAQAAFRPYRETGLEERARFLESIAAKVDALGEELTVRAMAETGLPRARLEGERGRTVFQLRLFASVVRDGRFLDLRVDSELPDRKPARRPDLRERQIALGPVAVFCASNFPLAFSVAGGDTASALAAGCPVVVKAHHAHPGTSELVGKAVQAAVREAGLHEGTFSMLFGSGVEIGAALVAAPEIQAVGFTGSRSGGLALSEIARKRPVPIPVYAEMSSINPVLLLPGALTARAASIARDFVASLTLGAGQFCTNPGLVLAIRSPATDQFLVEANAALANVPAHPMLTPGILRAYDKGVSRLKSHAKVSQVAQGKASEASHGQAALFATDAPAFETHPELAEEVFGAASLVVQCRDIGEMQALVEKLEGQLTIAVHMAESDHAMARSLLPILEEKAGRILVNGFGTGVEVSHAMVHGGPFPSTSDGRSTSVGSLAIRRFLRPVCYQDLPDAILPDSLKQANPLRLPRLVDGKPQAD